MRRQVAAFISGSALLLLASASPGHACVGRILNLSVNDSPEQKIIGKVIATYINERTGTTVNVVSNPETKDGSCPTDLCIQYVGSALAGMSDAQQPKDDQEAYNMVKEYYLDKQSIVWLKPLGYKGPIGQQDKPSQAVPVVKRETLNQFPIVDRVINKLGDLINDEAAQQLVEKSQNGDEVAVAKEFLKSQKLI